MYQFLNSAPSDTLTDLMELNAYPVLKALFVKFNTLISSSAPVERIFSFSKMILRPQRQRLNDKTYEELLILKTSNIL